MAERPAPAGHGAWPTPPRYKIIAIQAAGYEGIDYVVRDTVTGDNISDWFPSRGAAEHWLAITGLQ